MTRHDETCPVCGREVADRTAPGTYSERMPCCAGCSAPAEACTCLPIGDEFEAAQDQRPTEDRNR